MTFTRRQTWPNKADDYVLLYNGIDVGRCYLRRMSDQKEWWGWTIYTGTHIKKMPEGVPTSGLSLDLDEALEQFKSAFNAVVAAGAFEP